MAKKLQQYHIYKFNSERLKRKNYKIEISISEGIRNGEVVSIGDSQMLRSLRKIKNIENSEEKISLLFYEKKKIKKQESSEENIKKLNEIEKELNKYLFVNEIISIQFQKKSHYRYIGKNGLYINGKKFIRLLCSAGNARKNIAIFCDESIEKDLKRLLNNDRKDIEIIPNKFSAYFSLASSSTLPVSFPEFVVVPDCEIKRKEMVEYIEEDESGDDKIYPIEKEIDFNIFDGQGLISPRKAKEWSEELGLDYTPSAFIIRSNFIKGLVIVFDFVKFSDEIAEKHIIKDIWGNDYNIRDADIILTQSQFKLWNAWNSLSDYISSCKKNNIIWGISKYSPKEDKTIATMNYQFLQVLDLNDEKIEKICKKTVDYFHNIINDKESYSLLYLLGDICNREFDSNIFYKISDSVTKALILKPELIDDPYIKNHIYHSLNKKIKESYIGNIIVDGNYQFLIDDPYAMCEYVFDMPIKGLLNRNEYYNKYWSSRNVNKVASFRAPLTWISEASILNLKNNDEVAEWYKYIYSGIILNVFGVDHMIFGGSDADGDLLLTTNQPDIIDSVQGGLPIYYETKKAEKIKIIEEELYIHDLKGFDQKVGFLTNILTSMHSMLELFDKDSKEYEKIINRMKQCRKEQGLIIDAIKGLNIRSIPKHWTNWTKSNNISSGSLLDLIKLNNSIMIDKRPYFFKYLYKNYSSKYDNYYTCYNNYCVTTFAKTLEEVMINPSNKDEEIILSKYNRFVPLLDTTCIMNNLCHYMESKVKEIKLDMKHTTNEKNILLLKNPNIETNKEKLKQLYALYKKYKSEKRNFLNIKNTNGEEIYRTIDQYNKFIRKEALKISSNISELASLAVDICYRIHPSDNKSFCWNVFGEGIVENILLHKDDVIKIPTLDENGDIEFLGKKYKKEKINISDDNEDIYEYNF